MDNIRMVSSVVLFIIATYLAVLNWIVFYRRYIKKREGVSSWIPFLAGIFGIVAVLLNPVLAWQWVLVPLLI